MNWFVVIVFVVAYYLGYLYGHQKAHVTVARECERLGSFYVGDKTYVCTDIKIKEKEE